MCVCVWSWLMGVNGLGGNDKRMSHLKETGIWPTIYYSEAHLEQIFVHWCRLEEWAQSERAPSPSFPLPLVPFPLLLSPDKAAQEHSDRVVAEEKDKQTLIYFPLPAAAAAEGDGGMWSGTMTNKQRRHDCKILWKFLQDEVERMGCDTRMHKRVLAYIEKSYKGVFWGHYATKNVGIMTHMNETTVAKWVCIFFPFWLLHLKVHVLFQCFFGHVP